MSEFADKLIVWYEDNKRDLPWRDTKDPYRIWISEIILQQTRVAQGYDYFVRFMERFPDVFTLAQADEDEVMKHWQGLGYICTFLTLTNSFKLFDQNLALTGGLPSVIQNGAKVNITELLALNIYSTYNINKNFHGVAQAKAVIFFILVAVLALAQQKMTRSKEVEA